ncbi:hypothetical protein IQ272_31495, partial [Chroococcidiopsidales cyanobacterium LEGE 13417]|nr:hypothetical protein [Chroococcidiopsidales cyanobacterium LEGE 13417]
IYIEGKRFGSIDAESTQEAEAKGWIKLDKNGSAQLQLKFKSIVTEGAGAYLIAETPTGNLLKIHKINDEFKGIKYDDREFRTLSASSRGYKEKVFFAIDNKTVGVLNNTKESLAALNALKIGGLFNGSSSTLPCKMQSNFTSCIVTVDSNTVQYPETWVKESSLKTVTQLNQNLERQKDRQQIHSQIHNIITERPTILFQSQEDKMLGLIGLAVDSRKVDTVSKWLTKVGIEYSQIPPAEAKRESKKGLAVFMLSGSTIRPEILENLNTKFGKVADASPPISDIPITEQSILFYNPHQSYTDGNTNTTIQTEAYGLVVPAQDSIVVSSWLSSQDIKVQSFIENNCITFVIERNQFNDEFVRQVVSKLGKVIDVSTQEGYEQYEQKLNELNENLNQSDTSILQGNIPAKSEYQQIIDCLPARPKELLGQRENTIAHATPAAPQQPTGISSDSNNPVATQATDASLTDTRREQIAASTGQPTAKQNSQLSIQEIVAYGNQIITRATNPRIPENPIVSGKPVPMVYDLHTYDEPKTLPVNTTIDAMRGYGRVHTTRSIDYEKAYGIKEGDIAIAVGKDGRQVAFRVGKQYEISTEAIADLTYQQAWAAWEKHSVKELTQTQA